MTSSQLFLSVQGLWPHVPDKNFLQNAFLEKKFLYCTSALSLVKTLHKIKKYTYFKGSCFLKPKKPERKELLEYSNYATR